MAINPHGGQSPINLILLLHGKLLAMSEGLSLDSLLPFTAAVAVGTEYQSALLKITILTLRTAIFKSHIL